MIPVYKYRSFRRRRSFANKSLLILVLVVAGERILDESGVGESLLLLPHWACRSCPGSSSLSWKEDKTKTNKKESSSRRGEWYYWNHVESLPSRSVVELLLQFLLLVLWKEHESESVSEEDMPRGTAELVRNETQRDGPG